MLAETESTPRQTHTPPPRAKNPPPELPPEQNTTPLPPSPTPPATTSSPPYHHYHHNTNTITKRQSNHGRAATYTAAHTITRGQIQHLNAHHRRGAHNWRRAA
ncbi:hypothetical protein P8452_45894 [Trifolium repens]|nr:hypothetical protein P8452_45894 [Trifolium repens]